MSDRDGSDRTVGDRDQPRVLVLGPTVVRRAERDQDLRGPAARTLLTVLAAARGEPVTDARLLDLLWSGSPPPRAAATLQSHVSRLRSALGDADRTLLRRAGEGYALTLPEGALDTDTAARLVAGAQAAEDPRTALAQLDAALALWRGTPYADAGDDELGGIGPERARLEELREHALELRLTLRLALGDAAAALPDLVRRTREAPFRERGWELLVLALYRTGRQADALAALREVRRLLDDELGVVPGEALQRLEAAVLAQDPTLLLRPPPVPVPAVPATSPSLVAGTVRRPSTRFVGRREELARLAGAVGASPLVTVTGPGGVGKTRLVVELLADRDDPDGPWLVRLADARPGFVALHVASALGLSAPGEPAPALTAALGARRGLLVLDNCEHVRDEAAELVAQVLQAASGVTVLTTSREPLGLDGEVVLPLAPLAGDAVDLLVDRITAVRPGWEPGAADREALPRIAAALDGLPLALELAAARSRLLSLTELAGNLHDAPSFAARLNRGGLNPHATLAAAVDWTLDLLSPQERDLLLRLWPFDGGLPLDAAQAVAEEDDVLPLLGALVSRSVLTADTARVRTRFGLLETVRARCRQLDPDPDGSRARHARWVRALAAEVDEAMEGPAAGAASRRMDEELPNLRAALTHDLAVDPVEALRTVTHLDWWLYRRGHVAEGLRWLGDALAAAPDAPAVLRARALTAVGALRSLDGDLASGFRAFASAQAELERVPADDPDLARTRVLVTHYVALGRLFLGEHRVAERTALANLDAARSLGIETLVATSQLVAGAAAVAQGRVPDGVDLLRRSVTTAEAAGHRWAAALAERLLAAFVLSAGDAGEALALACRAASRSASEDDVSGVLGCLLVAAPALVALGRAGDAATVAVAVTTRARRVGLRLDVLALEPPGELLAGLAQAGGEEDRQRGERLGREASLAELVAGLLSEPGR